MNINLLLKRSSSDTIDVMIGAIFIVGAMLIGIKYPNETFEIIGGLIGIAIIFFKDISGRSLGKRLLNLYIVDTKTGEKPKAWKLLLRNFLLPLRIFIPLAITTGGRQTIDDKILKIEVIEGEKRL